MKFTKVSQLVLVSVLVLGLASVLTACQIVTADYIFVANNASVDSSANGEVAIFAVDSQSGALRSVRTPVSTGGASPVALAATTDYSSLYVANAGGKNIAHLTVAINGALTQKDKVSLSDSPVALAVNPADTYLLAVSGTTSATLSSFKLSSGAIGSAAAQQTLSLAGVDASYANDVLVPTAVTVLANGKAVFATVVDQSAYNPGGSTTSTANPGWIFGFILGSDGSLTAVPGSPWKAGVKPTGVAAEPTNRFVYVTDFASAQMIAYSIQSGDELNFLINGPFKTGNEPQAIVIDPRGKYIYVANSLDSTVSAYVIDASTGTPSTAVNTTGSASNSTDTQPIAIAIDPAEGRYVYTANYLGNSVSGFRLDPNAGTLTQTQATPYPTGSKPTALLAVPHGNHATQWVPST